MSFKKEFFFWSFLFFIFSFLFLNTSFFKPKNFGGRVVLPKIIEIKRENFKKLERNFSFYLTKYQPQFLKKQEIFKSFSSFWLLQSFSSLGEKVDHQKKLIKYKVKKGDTLFKIAKKFGVDFSSIIFAKEKKSLSRIYPGEELLIALSSGILHEVKENETLKEIAKKYRIPLKILKETNQIEEVRPGEVILIPQRRFLEDSKKNSLKEISSKEFFSYFQIPSVGWRLKGFEKKNEFYISNSCGTPVYAAGSGIVLSAKKGFNNGLGNYIEIQHPNGRKTLYGHLEKILVKPGQFVLKGEKIATMGKTGKLQKKGCLLYFQIQ